MKEREIKLSDLMIEIFFHWRGIIFLMLIGGICFGGISYIQSSRSIEAQMQYNELMLSGDREAIFREQLTEKQILNVKSVIIYEDLYDLAVKFNESSIIMKLNPHEVAKAQLLFLVTSDDLEHTYNIEKVYEGLVSSNSLYAYLISKNEIESSSVNEIVKLEGEGMEKNTDTFQLTVFYYEEEQCSKLAHDIINYVEEQKQDLQDELGEHDVIVLNQSLATVSDVDIYDFQNEHLNDVLSVVLETAKLKGAFTDMEKQYYEYLVSIEDATDNSNEEKVEENVNESNDDSKALSAPSISIKYCILGMAFSAFVYVLIISLCYFLDNKIKYSDDLQELYEVPQLGRIPKERSDKILGFIDEWISNLCDRDKRKFTSKETVNLVAVAIKIAAKKANLKSLSLIGCDIKGKTLYFCEQVKEILEKEGIKTEIFNNALYDAVIMEKLGDVEAAVLVETAGSTLYEEIYREVDLIQRQNIVILGGVVQG